MSDTTTRTMTLHDYANDRDYVVICWAGVGRPMGDMAVLGHPDLDFADRNGLLELNGEVDEFGEWEWDGEWRPTDDQRNPITQLSAAPAEVRWKKIVAEYEAGD